MLSDCQSIWLRNEAWMGKNEEGVEGHRVEFVLDKTQMRTFNLCGSEKRDPDFHFYKNKNKVPPIKNEIAIRLK